MTIREEIEQLKKEKNAVILAHYYVRPEVQEIADYIGDSFYLSKVAVELEEQTLVFCGASFMGESASSSAFERFLNLLEMWEPMLFFMPPPFR